MDSYDKVSIIIPVYNSEKYLKECLESVKNIDYPNYEVIVINDGSTDNSKSICDSFSYLDNFKIFHKKNEGVSKARNFGIKNATGIWVLFVDSDDLCSKDILKKIVDSQYDLTIFGYEKKYVNKVIKIEPNVDMDVSLENKYNILIDNKISGYLWNKLFDLRIIKKNRLEFDEKIAFCEDLYFITQYLNYVANIRIINSVLYSYRVRKNNTMNTVRNIKNLCLLTVYDKLSKQFENSNKEISDYFRINYIICFYKLRPLINKYQFKVNYDILCQEKILIKSKNKERFKLFVLKYLNFLYYYIIILKKLDNKKFD